MKLVVVAGGLKALTLTPEVARVRRRTEGTLLLGGCTMCLAPLLLRAVAGPDQSDDACVLPPTLETVHSASDCEVLFGDARTRKDNADHRVALLEQVDSGPYAINVVYSGDWAEPRPIDFRELGDLQTVMVDGCAPLAVAELNLESSHVDCAPGFYLFKVDDSLGPNSRVLAILDQIVLVEHNNELRYLSAEAAAEPVWRMIWHPSWKFHGSFGASGSSPAQPTRPSRR